MSTSEKQIEANRLNALKSTGPRTASGKASSRRNSLKHGVLSSVVLADDEDAEAFNALVKSMVDEHQPQSQYEVQLVEKLALLHWRERRLADTERRMILKGKEHAALARKPVPDFVLFDFPLDGISLANQLLVGRYQTMLNNQIAQTLAMLQHAQKQRVQQEAIEGDFQVLPAVNDSAAEQS